MLESLAGAEGGTLALLVLGLAIAFGFESVNGFHDTANAVGDRHLHPVAPPGAGRSAGATLGYIVGRTVVRVNGRPLEASRGLQVNVSPVVGRRTRAVNVAVSF